MTELTVQQPAEAASPIAMASVAMMMDSTKLQSLITFAEMMAKSTISVPDHLRNKPSDCLAIAMQAAQWGMNPFQVAQKTHIVSGRLGYEAQLVNAVVQASGQIKGGFKYEFEGEGPGLKCRVGAVLRNDSEVTWGEWLCISDVTTKNSPLWKTNPKQQMAYLQTKNWSRLYCPGAILGIYSDDELIDADTPLPPGTRQMGPVDEVKRPTTVEAMPTYDAAQFEANLPTWTGVIQSGRKTPDQIIDMVQTKARLSDEQKARIRAAGVVDNDTGAVGDQADPRTPLTNATAGVVDSTVSPKVVEKRLRAAKSTDELDLAADQIRDVADQEQALALTNLYRALRAQLEE